MNDFLLQRAQQAAELTAAEINKLPVIPQVRTLENVFVERIEERKLEKIAPKTGYPRLDNIVIGFIPGHVYVVTGETNVGKTKLGVNFAIQVAFQMKRVLYVALEPENMILEYIASVFHDKRFNELTDDDINLEGLRIDVVGKKEIDSLTKLINFLEITESYDLIVIDHVGYFINSQQNQIQEQGNAMKKIVKLAQDKHSAIMVVAHLRKKPVSARKDYAPTADDISGSGAFSRDATEVFIVTRTELESEEGIQLLASDGLLHVVKSKRGNNAKIPIKFMEGKAVIKEA